MKISYERLNQIIEEEVFKFKRLNEDTSSTPGSAGSGAKVLPKPIATMSKTELIAALTEKANLMSDQELKDLVGRVSS